MDSRNFNLTKAPAVLETGERFLQFINNQPKRALLKKLKSIRESINTDSDIDFPSVSIEVNEEFDNEYKFRLFGTVVFEGEIDDFEGDWEDGFVESIREVMETNSECFKIGFFDDRLRELEREQTREAYNTLWNYYRRVKKDDRLSFHWLKKLCYFNVPKDLRHLIHHYSAGIGCSVDNVQANKVKIRMNGDKKDYYNF